MKDKDKARAYSKEYHQKNREWRNKDAREKRMLNKLKAIEYLGGRCHDCQQTYHHAVFDFHHLDPLIKTMNLGHLMNWNWGQQQEELNKCILLCANCHRLRTYAKRPF